MNLEGLKYYEYPCAYCNESILSDTPILDVASDAVCLLHSVCFELMKENAGMDK